MGLLMKRWLRHSLQLPRWQRIPVRCFLLSLEENNCMARARREQMTRDKLTWEIKYKGRVLMR